MLSKVLIFAFVQAALLGLSFANVCQDRRHYYHPEPPTCQKQYYEPIVEVIKPCQLQSPTMTIEIPDISVLGKNLGVDGSVGVTGLVPVCGTINFCGKLPATGLASILKGPINSCPCMQS